MKLEERAGRKVKERVKAGTQEIDQKAAVKKLKKSFDMSRLDKWRS